MFSFLSAVFAVQLSMIYASIDNPNKIVFGARCQARCLNAKELCHGKARNCGPVYKACIKVCDDNDFYKVKSCNAYCVQFKGDQENRGCRGSCKYLMKLYNHGQNAKLVGSNGLPTPTAVISTLNKRSQSMLIRWQYNFTTQTATIFIVESRNFIENIFFATPWTFVTKTNHTYVKVKPKTATWCEYRVLAVTQDGVSDYSPASSAVFVMPNRPSKPRDFKVIKMYRSKDKVSIQVAWRKPEISPVPIHRYKIFWSQRLDTHTKELQSLRLYEKKIPSRKHSTTITGLLPNTTYVLEIQAICRVKGKRIKSKIVYLNTRTIQKGPKKNLVDRNFNKNFKGVKVKTTQSSSIAVYHQKESNSKGTSTININCFWFVTSLLITTRVI